MPEAAKRRSPTWTGEALRYLGDHAHRVERGDGDERRAGRHGLADLHATRGDGAVIRRPQLGVGDALASRLDGGTRRRQARDGGIAVCDCSIVGCARDDLALVHVADAVMLCAGLRFPCLRGLELGLGLAEARHLLGGAQAQQQVALAHAIIDFDLHLRHPTCGLCGESGLVHGLDDAIEQQLGRRRRGPDFDRGQRRDLRRGGRR
jgi:hypothetical protein